jgi:hypothetical protein
MCSLHPSCPSKKIQRKQEEKKNMDNLHRFFVGGGLVAVTAACMAGEMQIEEVAELQSLDR